MKRLLKIVIIFAVFCGLTANLPAQFPSKIPYNWITFNMDFWGTITLHGGPLIMKETTTPAAAAGFGKIYTKADNIPYFQDGAGNEHAITTVLTHIHYAEMYIYNNGGAMTIDEVSTWHGTLGYTEGDNGAHMTFHASIRQAITAWADAGGTPNEVTATSNGIQAAGLIAGEFITITGTTNYNGVYEVLSVATNTFNIEHADAGDDAAGTITLPSHYIVSSANAAGLWTVTVNFSVTPAANSKEYDLCLFVNGTPQTDTFMTHKTKDAGDYDTVSFDGLTTLANGDILWLGIMGKTDGTNITFKHANFAMVFIQ